MKKIILFVLLYSLKFSLYGQSTYIGLKAQSNVTEGQTNALSQSYWPKFQLIDNVLYVPTVNGIYSKDVNALSDTLWNLYGFSGVPIRDFIKNGNQVIAITNNFNDSLLVYSNDGGSSYTYRSDVHFVDPELVPSESNTTIHQIAHNSPSFDTVLVSHHFGISLSTDTGNTWSLLAEYAPEYQYRFIDFNPVNSQKLYSTGEDGFFSSYVYASSDGGDTWNTMHSVFNDCVHLIAFHPFEQETYLIGREGRISKSTDGGVSWSTFDLDPYLYVYQFKYDTEDPNIVYASGGINGEFDIIYFLKSTDAGDTWSVLHQEIPGNGNVAQVLDFEIIDDGIVYLTALGGLYYLESSVLSTDKISDEKVQIQLYPNPVWSNVTLRSSEIIEELTICDNLGRVVRSEIVNSTTYNLNVESFERGVYYLHVLTHSGKQIKKMVKN